MGRCFHTRYFTKPYANAIIEILSPAIEIFNAQLNAVTPYFVAIVTRLCWAARSWLIHRIPLTRKNSQVFVAGTLSKTDCPAVITKFVWRFTQFVAVKLVVIWRINLENSPSARPFAVMVTLFANG
jgi:hypothetical protein